uniref:Ubiquitin-like modifier-activating enzyme ATG7 n=1 Tax=Schistosoma mansoni TaxID=6183 RepID=A0A5K4F609_SCHMA
MSVLQYIPFETVIDTSFWHGLADRKLNEYRLSEGPFEISAQFTNSHAPGVSPRLTIDVTSFCNSSVKRSHTSTIFNIYGSLFSLNSLDEFKDVDKQCLLNEHGAKFMTEAISQNEFLRKPDLLLRFILLTYCDLKKYKFYFWFAFPAVLHSVQPVVTSTRSIREEFSEDQLVLIFRSFDCWRKENTSPFFVLKSQPSIDILPLSGFELAPYIYVGMCDSSVDPQSPCWLLRNLLYALSSTIIRTECSLKVLCLRDRFASGERYWEHSIVIHINIQPTNPTFTQFVGWEKWKNKLRPRVVDLSESMDPVKLAESAVDLNLKLMKWRLMPDLKLSVFRDTKCLLIGAGTLGCNVARQLLAWGVRHITLIDNSTVSFSNPVRQSLYVFSDSVGSVKNKALVAAEALQTIFPGVNARGFDLSIPMPGHPVSSYNRSHYKHQHSQFSELEQSAEDTCFKLSALVQEHDVIFLLTDTRESRWLPTVLATAHGKLAINAALGFDTFLVMRHGVRGPFKSPSLSVDSLTPDISSLSFDEAIPNKEDSFKKARAISGSLLGCYFCNDVIGPMNSTRNRSLDQQCTVTRPGVSMVAAALAVELMVSVLQHPLLYEAPADTLSQDFSSLDSAKLSLGVVPHQIRGFLSHYTQVLPATLAFTKCSACSQSVLNAYKANGYTFLRQVFDDASYLERICGLQDLHDEINTESILMLSDTDD